MKRLTLILCIFIINFFTFAECVVDDQKISGTVLDEDIKNISDKLYSQTLVDELMAKGFRCFASSTDDKAKRCVGQIDGYPKRVSLIIPNDLISIEQLTLHFHGHLLTSRSGTISESQAYDNEMKLFNFEKYTPKNKNSLLIIPESADYDKTFNDYFYSEKKFDDFFLGIQKALSTPLDNVKGVSLSGHSGAFKVIDKLCGVKTTSTDNFLSKINEIKLYDATYVNMESTKKWFQARPQERKVIVNYVEGSGTETGALYLKTAGAEVQELPVKNNPKFKYPYNLTHFQALFDHFEY